MNKPNENATTQELETTPGATPETGADDPLDLKAADLLGITAEPTEEEEPKTDEEEEESNTEPEEGEDGKEDDEPAESEEDDSDTEVPSLDAAIQNALKDQPELLKRWGDQWKGLKKREAKQAEWDEGITNLFSDREYARETIPAFVQKVAAVHGLSLEELLGGEASDELQPPDPNAFDNYDDQIAATQQYVEAKVSREMQALREEVAAMKAEQAKQSQKAERDKALDQALGQVQRVFDKEHQGFKVTRKMLVEAVEMFPHLEPVKAVKAAQVDSLVAHRGKVVANAQRVDAPTMLRGQTGKGIALPDDPTEVKAHHLLGLRG
jgi:hypothetical protein